MSVVKYLITVDESHFDLTHDVANAVRDNGLSIGRIIESAGAIEAIGDENDLGKLEIIEGVGEVRSDKGIFLPPMNTKIPQ